MKDKMSLLLEHHEAWDKCCAIAKLTPCREALNECCDAVVLTAIHTLECAEKTREVANFGLLTVYYVDEELREILDRVLEGKDAT